MHRIRSDTQIDARHRLELAITLDDVCSIRADLAHSGSCDWLSAACGGTGSTALMGFFPLILASKIFEAPHRPPCIYKLIAINRKPNSNNHRGQRLDNQSEAITYSAAPNNEATRLPVPPITVTSRIV